MITRLTLLAACATTLCGVLAGQALAQTPTPTVSPATAISPESAMLHGQIPTNGQAAEYSFEYDTVSDWNAGGDNASFTDDTLIPATDTGTVDASAEAGCYPALTCTDQLPLQPNTKYIFVLSVQYNITAAYYDVATVQSTTETFTTTNLGRIVLASKTIAVKKGVAKVELTCTSAVPCRGALVVTTRHHGNKVTCLSGTFSVGAGHTSTLREAVSGACQAFLRKSHSGSWSGTLNAVTTTDQPGIVHKPVKLVLVPSKKK